VLGLNGFLFGGAGAGLSGWFIFAGSWIAAVASVRGRGLEGEIELEISDSVAAALPPIA